MATLSSILAWKTPWTEEPGGLQSKGSQKDMTEHTHTHLSQPIWDWTINLNKKNQKLRVGQQKEKRKSLKQIISRQIDLLFTSYY